MSGLKPSCHLRLSVQQALLDGEDLLRNGRQDALLETVELVEAAPRAHLPCIWTTSHESKQADAETEREGHACTKHHQRQQLQYHPQHIHAATFSFPQNSSPAEKTDKNSASRNQRPARRTQNTNTPHLAQPREQPAHSRVVERLVAVEHQHETPQLCAQGLDRLCLARAGRAEGVAAHAEVQGLGQGEVTPAVHSTASIGERKTVEWLRKGFS